MAHSLNAKEIQKRVRGGGIFALPLIGSRTGKTDPIMIGVHINTIIFRIMNVYCPECGAYDIAGDMKDDGFITNSVCTCPECGHGFPLC